MAKVKICGLKRPEDIEYVNKTMPEYVGFVFAKSRRQVTVEQSRQLQSNLDQRIKTVGVFVNESQENLVNIARECGLDAIQLHGDETPEFIIGLRDLLRFRMLDQIEIWKALRVKDRDSLKNIGDYKVDALLLDTYVENCYGGAGKTFDWGLAAEAGRHHRVILAGGLNGQNVHEAIRIVQPYAVDVSSGVETEGCKDEEKIKAFVCMARSYE